MVGLILLREAGAADLAVRADGDRLVIRGPKQADAVARRLLNHKAEVIAALVAETEPFIWPPPSPYGPAYLPAPPLGEKSPLVVPNGCWACGGRRWWHVAGKPGMPTCARCHPPSPALDVEFEDHTEISASHGGQP